jgi:hypothetical protein
VLDAGDLKVAFDRLRGSPCFRALEPLHRERFELLQAMAERDAQGMRRTGEALLALPGAGLDPARAQWLAAALTGHLAAGDNAGARRLWNQHATRLTAAGRATLPMRVLRARLEAQP